MFYTMKVTPCHKCGSLGRRNSVIMYYAREIEVYYTCGLDSNHRECIDSVQSPKLNDIMYNSRAVVMMVFY